MDDKSTDTIIHTNLHYSSKPNVQSSLNYTEHQWKIYVTDIFESGKGVVISEAKLIIRDKTVV